MFKYFRKLVESNTGVSSKSFFLIIVTIIGCLLLIVPGFILVYEVVCMGTIATDLTGLAAYIGAVASLFATAGITKVWGEKYEQKYICKKDKHNENEEEEKK